MKSVKPSFFQRLFTRQKRFLLSFGSVGRSKKKFQAAEKVDWQGAETSRELVHVFTYFPSTLTEASLEEEECRVYSKVEVETEKLYGQS